MSIESTSDEQRDSVAVQRLVRFWHKAWALYHSLENHAACRRGDISAALNHAEKELQHIAKTPLIRKPNTDSVTTH